MIIKLAKRMFSRHHNERDASGRRDAGSKAGAGEQVPSVKVKTEWEQVLTESLKQNALAPSEEVILHAYDLYCDELHAPFLARRRAINERFSNVVAGLVKLQALAPEMVERAAAKHRLEVNRFIEKKDDD